MKRLFLIILIIPICFYSFSQPIEGMSGLMKIPSAEMQQDGTFIFGGNYLPDAITASEYFNYDTGNYFFDLTFLPFLEFAYRSTIMTNDGIHNQDRSFGLRLQLLKEKKLLPAFVIGGNDLYSTGHGIGNNFFNSFYGVASKHLQLNQNRLGFTLGFGTGGSQKLNLKGVFGGIAFTPAFFPSMRLMAEYDADVVNAGIDVLLFRHLYLMGMAYNLKYFAGGLAYRIYFKN